MTDPERSIAIQRQLLRALRRRGELSETALLSPVCDQACSRPPKIRRAEARLELSRLAGAGVLTARRATEPVAHGSRWLREFTYWSLSAGDRTVSATDETRIEHGSEFRGPQP